jgi:hypothetical protein
MFKVIENIAGKQRWIITIPGLVIIWLMAALLMPKSCSKKSAIKTIGVWFSSTDTGYVRMEIKSSGYFYFNQVAKRGKAFEYKGIFDIAKEKNDTILLVSFNADTILFATITSLSNNSLLVKSIYNNSFITFKKQ